MVTEEAGSEVEEAGISVETAVVVTVDVAAAAVSATAVAAVVSATAVAMATTEADRNAASAKRLNNEAQPRGRWGLAVTLWGCFYRPMAPVVRYELRYNRVSSKLST